MIKAKSATEMLSDLKAEVAKLEVLREEQRGQIGYAVAHGKPIDELSESLLRTEKELISSRLGLDALEPLAAAERHELRRVELEDVAAATATAHDRLYAEAQSAKAAYDDARQLVTKTYAAHIATMQAWQYSTAQKLAARDQLDVHNGVDLTARGREEARAAVALTFPHINQGGV